jgi:hypothetical protein
MNFSLGRISHLSLELEKPAYYYHYYYHYHNHRNHHHNHERCRFRAVSPVLCNSFALRRSCSLHLLHGWPTSLFPWGWYCSVSFGKRLFYIMFTCWSQFFAAVSDLIHYIFLVQFFSKCQNFFVHPVLWGLGVVLESAFVLPLVVSVLTGWWSSQPVTGDN